jgi:hypothetical protein
VLTIKPGYFVSSKTELRGGVKRKKTDLRNDLKADGSQEREYQTEIKVKCKKEWEAAVALRAKVAGMVAGKCKLYPFGLACSEADLPKVEQAKAEAEELCNEFNKTSSFTTIHMHVSFWFIASDDVRAMQLYAKELEDLARQMRKAIDEGKVKEIREAARMAARFQMMLGEKESQQVGEAVKAARKAAMTISREVVKKGQQVEEVLPKIKTTAISRMRFAFLGKASGDGATEKAAGDQLPSVNVKRFAQLRVKMETKDDAKQEEPVGKSEDSGRAA